MADDKDDTLATAKKRFSEGKDAFKDNRDRMVEDLKFSNPADPQQWDPAIRTARASSANGSRPCLTFDQTNQYIAQVVNDSRQNKPGIKVIPTADGADVDVALKLEGLIRHIEYQSRASIAYDTAIEYAARIGLGWVRVVTEVVDAEKNEQEIRIKRVHDPLSVVIDPNAMEPDGSDADWGFVESKMTRDDYEKEYPDAQPMAWEGSSSHDDWCSKDSIRICEYFYKERTSTNHIIVAGEDGSPQPVGEEEYWALPPDPMTGTHPARLGSFTGEKVTVKWCKLSGSEILEETDFPSKYIPLIPVLGYELWIEGERFLCGMTRRMRDSQQAYNYERTSYIEQVALQPKAPFVGDYRAFENFESEWRGANTSNRAYLPYNGVDGEGNEIQRPERQQPPAMSQALIQGGQLALADVQASIGMYRSNLGAPSNAVSGKAKQADERQGDTANFHYTDNQNRAIEQLGRIIVDMVPIVYDTKRQARITGDDGKVDQVTIDPDHPQAITKPPSGQPGTVTINPGVGTYDVRVQAGPSYSTLRQESAEAIGNILQTSPQLMAVLGPEWAKMQDWPNAEKISRMLLAMAPPQVQAIEQGDTEIPPAVQAQMAQMKQQIEQMGQQLQQANQKLESDSVTEMGKQYSAAEDRKLAWYEAETARLAAMKDDFNPQQIAQMAAQVVMDTINTPADTGQGQPPMPPPGMGIQPQGMPPGLPPPGMPPGMQPPPTPQPPQGGFSLPNSNPLGGASP